MGPIRPRGPDLPILAMSCQPGPGHGPGALLRAQKLAPLYATTSRRAYVSCGLYVPRTVKLAPSRPALATQAQSAVPGTCAVSQRACQVLPSWVTTSPA